MITLTPHAGDSHRCSNCRKNVGPTLDLAIAGVGAALCRRCLGALVGVVAAEVPTVAAFEGAHVEAQSVGGNCVEARLYLPRRLDTIGGERHRGRAALYALATAIELAMHDVDVWSTTLYFHNDGAPVPDGFRGSVIIDCGLSAEATALALVRGIAEQLKG